MKRFAEKLIERLEEKKFKVLDSTGFRLEVVGFSTVHQIADQLAEEYTDKNCSECSRRKWYQIGYADAEKKLAEEYGNNFCEWKAEKAMFIQNPHTGRKYSNETSMQNVYCNTCGKRIKVVE